MNREVSTPRDSADDGHDHNAALREALQSVSDALSLIIDNKITMLGLVPLAVRMKKVADRALSGNVSAYQERVEAMAKALELSIDVLEVTDEQGEPEDDGALRCGWCDMPKPGEHRPKCLLAKALRDAKAAREAWGKR